MCGIAGIYAYRSAAPAADRAELLRIRDRMSSRGPDGVGEWVSGDGRIGLGHLRLSIIDLTDRGAQPMFSADRRLAITFNGEIYNYKALRAELEAQGRVFQTDSDTEVLLQLYEVKGAAMVHDLRGMFAFGLWDARKRGLLLARDAYGIKPLYFADEGGTIRFASQVKALLAGGAVSRDPDSAGWVGFHLLGSVPEPFTTYRAIRSLPAGSTMWIDEAAAREPESFFNIAQAYVDAQGKAPLLAPSDLQSHLRAALLDSVQAHMVADVPVGIFLSAGIDSGSLLGLMRDAGQQEIQAITLGYSEFRDLPEDETLLAARCARHYGSRHSVRIVTEDEFREDLPRFFEAMDQPSIDGINTWFVSKAAHEHGLKAAISGLGGDELFGGYPSFVDVPRWVRMWGGLARTKWAGETFRLFAEVSGLTSLINPKAGGMLAYGGTYPGAYFLRRGVFLPRELSRVMDPAIVREGLQRLQPVKHVAGALQPEPAEPFAKVAALEAALYMRNQLLRDADWASMAHSLEVRVPLVDSQLLREIAPWSSMLAEAGKRLLAGCPTRPLPGVIVERAKTGFTTPFADWLQRDPRLQSWRKLPELNRPRCPWARRWAYQLGSSSGALARLPEPVKWDSSPGSAAGPQHAKQETVLIFRIGSLGDTIVALPCFHLVARAFPRARRVLVTDIPGSAKVAPVESVLGKGDLIHDVIYFPPPPRRVADILELRRRVRETGATTIVHISDRKLWGVIRDRLFFVGSGIKEIIGAPVAGDIRELRVDPRSGDSEYEAERLARCIERLGPIDLEDPRQWDLQLTSRERQTADKLLAPLRGKRFIAANMSAKIPAKDWGQGNWTELLMRLAPELPDVGLVFVGVESEAARSAVLAKLWHGPTMNLCGRLTPRETAAAMENADLFVGHDSGPLHLAAAVQVPCVGIYGHYNKPKRWHPMGERHVIIHRAVDVRSISPDEVGAAVLRKMAAFTPTSRSAILMAPS